MFTQEEILVRERARLAGVIQTGPHEVYQEPGKSNEEAFHNQFNEWIFDFSWNAASIQEWQWMLDDAQCMELMHKLKDKWGFDLEAFIRTCIVDSAAMEQELAEHDDDAANEAMSHARDGLE